MDILYSLFGTVWGYRRLRTTYKAFPYTPPQISPALLRHSHFWLLPVSPRVRCRYLIMAYRAAPRASSPPSLVLSCSLLGRPCPSGRSPQGLSQARTRPSCARSLRVVLAWLRPAVHEGPCCVYPDAPVVVLLVSFQAPPPTSGAPAPASSFCSTGTRWHHGIPTIPNCWHVTPASQPWYPNPKGRWAGALQLLLFSAEA